MTATTEDMMSAGIMTGTVHILASIVRILELNQLLRPDEFAEAMIQAATELEAAPGSPFPPNFPRPDALMMRRMATLLQRPEKGWKPVVIDGGLTPPKKH